MRQFSHPEAGENHLRPQRRPAGRHPGLTLRWKDAAEMVLDLVPELPAVRGLPQEMGQVFLNMILNAPRPSRDARPSGGRSGPSPCARKRDDEIRDCQRADTGPGIPEEIGGYSILFHHQGVGRERPGLALVYAIVERHDGEVFFETARAGEPFLP
jgi:signal transduction histidine kinase